MHLVTDQIKKTLGVVLVLVLGVGLWMLYSSVQPTVTRLQDHDPQALEALDLVKQPIPLFPFPTRHILTE